MNQNVLSRIVFLFTCLAVFVSCNEDKEKFSSAQIQRALFDLKGVYHGTVEMSYVKGSIIAKQDKVVAVSRDSLAFSIPLALVSETIRKENVARVLRDVGEVEVKAGYEFLGISRTLNFVLHPQDVMIRDQFGKASEVKLIFSQSYGGNAEPQFENIIFIYCLEEIHVDGKKLGDFKPLVLYFEGEMKGVR